MKLLLKTLRGEATDTPPIWLMRQAGRYLPEYRALRQQTTDFLTFCYTPEVAVEATMQPIRRYGFDAAILFSDILVVPDGLGQKTWFEKGEGPRLEVTPIDELVAQLSVDRMREFLAPVYETVTILRSTLPEPTTLIGFSASPWTLACYMLQGKGTRDFSAAREAAYRQPQAFDALIHLLERAVIAHCTAQIEAGAEVIQLFDSWAGACPVGLFGKAVISPTARIVEQLRARFPQVPIIGFPKGVGTHLSQYASLTGVQGMGIDFHTSLQTARDTVDATLALQGNLDPEFLAQGALPAIEDAVREQIQTMRGHPYIFNLGHGIVPHTPPEHVERLIEVVREAR
jgi:uroporphyrinogen decarboxylase